MAFGEVMLAREQIEEKQEKEQYGIGTLLLLRTQRKPMQLLMHSF